MNYDTALERIRRGATIDRAIRDAFIAEGIPLTTGQWDVLDRLVVWEETGRAATPGTLADEMGVARVVVSGLLERLGENGAVHLGRGHGRDKRLTEVTLTPRGRTMFRLARETVEAL